MGAGAGAGVGVGAGAGAGARMGSGFCKSSPPVPERSSIDIATMSKIISTFKLG
jgi:hypothetical protein